MNTGVLVKNGLGIAAVVLAAWASQQGYAQAALNNLASQKVVQDTPVLKNAVQWVNNGLASAAGRTQQGVGEARQRAAQQVRRTEQGTADSVKKFIAKKVLDVLGVSPQSLSPSPPNQNQCPTH